MLKRIIIGLFLLLIFVLIVYHAWLCDDAYITLRTVDNFVSGYGLTWNIAERVQSFTHPLWLFIITPLYAITGEAFLTLIVLSLVSSLAAIAILAFGLCRSTITGIIGLVTLLLSKSFIDFSTSGLENPLTVLIIALFLLVYFKKENSPKTLFYLSLITSLGLLTRLDLALIFIPPIVFYLIKHRPPKWYKYVLLGFSPIILWEIFSLFYYGFMLPNTAYAKIYNGIDRLDLIPLGWRYFEATLKVDPLTPRLILLGFMLTFLKGSLKSKLVAVGGVLYLLYVFYIGGDFMVGRFFHPLIFLSVALIIRLKWDNLKSGWILLGILIIVLGLWNSRSPVYSLFKHPVEADRIVFDEVAPGITDERLFYFSGSSLWNYNKHDSMPYNEWSERGKRNRIYKRLLVQDEMIGYLGFYSGPEGHIIDEMALADPLLARLPAMNIYDLRPGHFRRKLPDGYWETIETDNAEIVDTNLAEFYEKIQIITRGTLFSGSRIVEIFKFNLGYYDDWRDAYVKTHQKYLQPTLIELNFSELSEREISGVKWNGPWCTVMSPLGIEIILPELIKELRITMSLDDNDMYRLIYMIDDRIIASQVIHPSGRNYYLVTRSICVPTNAVINGYNKIKIVPISGIEGYSFGHLKLSHY